MKMPWKESGPPKERFYYHIVLRKMYSVEESFMKKDCFEIVDEEVQTLVNQGFFIKVAKMVPSPQSSVYSKKSIKTKLLFD